MKRVLSNQEAISKSRASAPRLINICRNALASSSLREVMKPVLVVCGMLVAIQPQISLAGFVIAHTGSADPLTEGFTGGCCGATTGPIADDMGHAAWSIDTLALGTQFFYSSGTFSPAQLADIATHGFVLTMEVRVIQDLAPAFDAGGQSVVIAGADVEFGSKRFEIELGIDSNGDTVVVLPNSIDNSGPGGSVRAPGTSYTLVGSGSSYHIYELVYDPTTELVDLFVDGVVRIQDNPGHSSFAANRGLNFGAWSGGQGNFALVKLESIPEPGALALAAVGLAAALAVVRRHFTVR